MKYYTLLTLIVLLPLFYMAETLKPTPIPVQIEVSTYDALDTLYGERIEVELSIAMGEMVALNEIALEKIEKEITVLESL